MIQLNPSLIPTGYRHGFEAYKLFSAVSNHIDGKFDGVKYRWKKKIPAQYSYESYPEKYLFEKIARNHPMEDWLLLFARNCINSGWARDVLTDDAVGRFLQARGFIENAEKRFENLFKSYLISCHNGRIKYADSLKGQVPFILLQAQQKVVPIEFLVLVDSATPFLSEINSLMYSGIAKRIQRYQMIFDIDTKLLRNAIKSACS